MTLKFCLGNGQALLETIAVSPAGLGPACLYLPPLSEVLEGSQGAPVVLEHEVGHYAGGGPGHGGALLPPSPASTKHAVHKHLAVI